MVIFNTNYFKKTKAVMSKEANENFYGGIYGGKLYTQRSKLTEI